MICEWCRCSFQAARQAGFCSRKCRQASFRLRHRRELEAEHAWASLSVGAAQLPLFDGAR